MRTQTRTFVSRFLLLFLLALTACGGSGGGGAGGIAPPDGNDPPGNPPPDDTAPVVEIVFPASRVVTEAAATLIVRGRATDDVTVTGVTVNGEPAESDNDFAQWSKRIPLEEGMNRIEILAVDAAGNRETAKLDVQNTTFLPDAFLDATWDAAGQRLFAVSYDGRIVQLQADSGEWRVLADAQHGSGAPFEPAEKVLWDAARERLLALTDDRRGLLAIDVESGERTLQENFFDDDVYHWQFDTLGDRLIVRDDSADAGSLQAIDPVTGDAEILLDMTGSTLSTMFAYDTVNNRAWFYERLDAAIIEVDLATDQARVLSDDDADNDPETADPVGAGDSLHNLHGLALSLHGDEPALLVLASSSVSTARLVRVDIQNGDRTVLSAAGVRGEGPALSDFNGGMMAGVIDDVIWVLDSEAVGADGIVRVDRATGNRLAVRDATLAAGEGPDPGPMGLNGPAFDPGRGELLFAGWNASNAVAVSIADGKRRIVTDVETGDGPLLNFPLDIAFDAAGDNAWMSERGPSKLIKVDSDTGDREVTTLVPEDGVSAPSSFAYEFALHPAAHRAYVIDRDLDRIYSVDLATGLYSVLSDPEAGIGAGDDFLVASGVVLDAEHNRLLLNGLDRVQAVGLGSGDRVTLLHTTSRPRVKGGGTALMPDGALAVPDAIDGALLRVNLDTGKRVEISDAIMDYEGATDEQRGTGPGFLRPEGVALVSAAPEILAVFDARREAVFLVDVESGDRVILSR